MSQRWALAASIAIVMMGCVDFARSVRQYTYPPEFRYLETDQVRLTMRQLAFHSRELSRLIQSNAAAEQPREQVIAHLRAMEQAAAKLDQSGWPSNHPLIDMNLPRFRRDLEFAREAVEREPPNYLLAGPVSGACIYCHGRR